MSDDARISRGDGDDCGFTRLHLHAYIEAELDAIRANMVRDHVEGCLECRELGEDLKLERLWVVESMVRSPALSGELIPKVMQGVEGEARRAAWASRRRAWFPWLGAAALLVAAALVAARFGGEESGEPGTDEESRLGIAPAPAGGPEERAVPPVPPSWRSHPLPPLVPLPDSRRRPEGERPFPESGVVPDVSLARARGGVPSFGHVVSFAVQLAPRDRPAPALLDPDPCKSDLNEDGRTDWSDVAYSCQVLVRGAPPDTLQAEAPAVEAPDCDDHCYRA
jgi:hypothetical protein